MKHPMLKVLGFSLLVEIGIKNLLVLLDSGLIILMSWAIGIMMIPDRV